ncbi:unnamed protein product [Mesocestoides corti]|uniref:Cytochrome b561 domain-containing protein n=1 Tax=Mesocestoides corti TaxID=53468 RepID=A0A158QTN8_MESCO|nr:unnamed protein product [Mesocestoides corti]
MLSFSFVLFIISGVFSFKDVDLSTCTVTKGCLRPPVCADNLCEYGATWRLVEQEQIQYIEFELFGDIKSSSGFISLVFSKDPYFTFKMLDPSYTIEQVVRRVDFSGGDGFVGCYYDTVDFKTVVRAGYRPEASDSNHLYNPADDEKLLITTGDDLGSSYVDAQHYLQCRFRRRVTPVKMANQLKDLAPPNAYYLIIQRGSDPLRTSFGQLFPGGEATSNESAIITSPLYDLTIDDTLMHAPGVVKAHGAMMVLAWVFCSSVGVIISRYYKDMWPNSGLLGERVWFQVHRILMGLCVGLTCLAVILAFIFCQGYSRLRIYPDYIHPILGLIVLCLAVINPFITFCRPHPMHKNRPYFNWTHFIIGTLAHVLSIPTIMLGLRMPAAGVQLRSLNYPLWILIFFVIFQFCVELTLEIHGCLHYRRNKQKKLTYRNEVEQYQNAVRVGGVPIPRPVEPEPSGRIFKHFMISLHATVAAIVAVVLIIVIAVN